MGWLGKVGEFAGSFIASFTSHRARIKNRTFGSTQGDVDINAYNNVAYGLKIDCAPIDDHVTRKGLKELCLALKINNHFLASTAIDGNLGPRKRDICLIALRQAVTYLCSEDAADLVRSATYTMIACK